MGFKKGERHPTGERGLQNDENVGILNLSDWVLSNNFFCLRLLFGQVMSPGQMIQKPFELGGCLFVERQRRMLRGLGD